VKHRTRRRALWSLVIASAVGALAVVAVVQVNAAEAPARPRPTVPPTTAGTTRASTQRTTTAPPTTTTTTAPPTTTTTAPTTTTAAPAGDEAVFALQQRLTDLHYWLGTPDGRLGTATKQAVLAFQKAEGLDRDGNPGPATLERLDSATVPQPSSLADGVEIDLERQILFVVRGGVVEWVFNTSTGTSRTPTPRGEFVVQRQIDGMRHAPLGDLYRPKYFNGGIAVHGSRSIPGYPASHGCARVSNAAINFIWAAGLMEIGTPVRVV
jgi:peptidoglycan hydrolase-like protein with peptidoglycan-binding domain